MIAGLLSSLLPSAAGVSRALTPRNGTSTLENPSLSLSDPKTWEGVLGGIVSDAGVPVTHRTALRVSPVWQCVDMISGDVASMTLNVHKRLEEDDREIDVAHPAQFLVSTRANKEVDAWTFWRRLLAHALLWGNGYAWVERSVRNGKPSGLYNLLPDRTRPMRDDRTGQLFYITEANGKIEALFPDEILHVKGLSVDLCAALDLVEYARNAIGLALAAESFGSKFFANGAQSGGFLEIPAHLTSKAAAQLEEGFRKKYGDKNSWFKSIVLREGAKWHAATIDAQKSQMHELRIDQKLDIAEFFKVPPFKLGLPGSVSYNSSEQAQLAYLTGCLNHWRMAVASECNIKLLTEAELTGNTRYFEHNFTNIIELDWSTLTSTMIALRNAEIVNANECRRKLNWPKRKDPGGDEYTNPNTKSALSQGGAPSDKPAEGAVANPNQESAAAAGDVQASALNGAQIAGLLTIAQQLVADQMPKEGTRALITASFPLMDSKLIETIVTELDKFEPAEPPAPEVPPTSAPPSAAVHAALRNLVADAVGRVARRVTFDARSAAKKPTKFAAWVDGKAADHREVFAEALRPVLATVGAVEGGDAEALLAVVSDRFFADALSRLTPLIEPPHSANDLAANVDAACAAFEAGIAKMMTVMVFQGATP